MSKATTEKTLPPRLTDAPEYQSELRRLHDLMAQKTAAERRVSELDHSLSTSENYSRYKQRLDSQAAELLGDAPAAIETVAKEDIRTEIDNLNQHRRVLERAIELQKHRLGRIVGNLSREYGEQIRDRYLSAIARIDAAFSELEAAMQEESDIRDVANESGYNTFSGNPFTAHVAMNYTRVHDEIVVHRIEDWRRQCRESGYLE